MKKFINFVVSLAKETSKDELFTHANEMTYKLLLAFFPFAIFLMSVVGFLRLDVSGAASGILAFFPDEAQGVINFASEEVFSRRSAGLLSGSLLVSIFTASNGFDALIRGIGKAYGEKGRRGFIKSRIISVCLVLLLAAVILMAGFVLIFGDVIYKFIVKNVRGFSGNTLTELLFGAVGYLVVMVIMLVVIILIYKLATVKKVTFYRSFPGAVVTLVVWITVSRLFNFYINNFTRYSSVYGSIAGIVILMLWLNVLSVALLIGAEINSLLEEGEESNET